jgi:retron-type reverse transcriptase
MNGYIDFVRELHFGCQNGLKTLNKFLEKEKYIMNNTTTVNRKDYDLKLTEKIMSDLKTTHYVVDELLKYRDAFCNFMSIMHCDKGEFLYKHGIEKTYKAAVYIRENLINTIDELKTKNSRPEKYNEMCSK